MNYFLLSLITLFASFSALSQEYRDDGLFKIKQRRQISKTLVQLKRTFTQMNINIHHDLKTRNLTKIESIYGPLTASMAELIIKKRLQKTQKILQSLTPRSFRSIQWARKHHKNKDFKTSLDDSHTYLYGAVNPFGKQSINDELYIEDNYIYLGRNYFKKNEKFLTLLHEISHLTEGDYINHPSEGIQLLNPAVDMYINTFDNIGPFRDLFSDLSLSSAYQWEALLLLYDPLIN